MIEMRGIVLAGVVVAACGAPAPLIPVTPWTHPPIPAPAMSQQQLVRLDPLVDAAAETVTSTELARAFDVLEHSSAYASLATSTTGPSMATSDVRTHYPAEALATNYYPGASHWWIRETAHTGLAADHAETVIRAVVQQRWDSGVLEARACAVNTVAHEWTHAIPDGAGDFLFGDGDHDDADRPLVSYTLGAVAQCVYLQRHGYPDMPIESCVQQVGTQSFDADTCGAGWARRFATPLARARPVELPGNPPLVRAVCSDLKSKPAAARADLVALAARCPHLTATEAKHALGALRQLGGGDAQKLLTFSVLDADEAGTATGASLESTAISAVVSVVASRAKAELEAYAIDLIRDLACAPSRETWFQATCAFTSSGTDDLPVTFGAGLRAALVADALAAPRHAVDLLAPNLVGTRDQLLAVTFIESVGLLVQRADLYEVAQQLAKLAGTSRDAFTCAATDAACSKLRADLGFIGAVLVAVRETTGIVPATTDLEAAITAFNTAHATAYAVEQEDLEALARLIEDAHTEAHALFVATTPEARLPHVKPFAADVVAVVNLLLRATTGPASAVGRRLPDGLPELLDAIARGDVQPIAAAAVTVLRQLPLANGLDAGALRLLSFAGEIASAKTTAESQAAIEAVIAPIGAYHVKRTHRMISLGSLVGLGFGRETLHSHQLEAGQRGRSAYFAPLGLLGADVSFLPLHNDYVPHLGIFISLLDVGSLLSFRFSDDPVRIKSTTATATATSASVDSSNNLGFAQLLAPGAFLRIPIGNSPIVLVGGVEYAPDARHVTATDAADPTAADVHALRWSAGIAVDVTLLPFLL